VDTRQKIHPAQAVAEVVRSARSRGETCRLVIGLFDPMLAAHARRLREHRDVADLLVVLVESVDDPLLPPRARAELVAGLASVNYVVIAGEQKTDLIAAFAEAQVDSETEADAKDTRELVLRIHERQRS
jgi:bifunctional ADP-heptose synthase (sugar kinase/adenylyltransferase)